MFVAMCVFVVSLISFILRFMADQSFGVWGTIALLGSLIGLFLSTKSAICAFNDSSRKLKRFKDRELEDKESRAEEWSKVKEVKLLDKFEPIQIECKNIYANTIADYAYVYPEFDKMLVSGLKITGSEKEECKTNCFNKVRNNLNDAQRIIALRKKCAQYKDFYNEDKINLVEFKINDKNGVELKLSKTCYYTSYLSVEFYRDCVEDTFGEEVGFGDIQEAPFVEGKLPLLNGDKSLHLGANTIAITKDGYALFWRQERGDHSNGLWSMSGMGSMDYEDLFAGGDSRESLDFNLVIKKAAERELTEEMFKGQIPNAAISKLPVIGKTATRKSIEMDTRIIGFFRWVALGGLPGFICVTKLDKTLNDLKSNNLFGLSEGAQCKGKESDLLRINCGDAEEIKKSIDNHIKKMKARYPISLPLCVAFDTLKRAVDNDDFRAWLISSETK